MTEEDDLKIIQLTHQMKTFLQVNFPYVELLYVLKSPAIEHMKLPRTREYVIHMLDR